MPQVHIVAYCGDLGYGAAQGAQMLSLMLGAGIVSRLVSGAICDRIGGLRTLLLGSVLQGLALLLFLPFDSLVSLYLISALFGLFQGGIVPAYAIIIREYFPPAEAGARVGTVLMFTLFGMALGGWMSGKVFDLTGSYHAAFLNGIAWNALNVSIALFLLAQNQRLDRPARRAFERMTVLVGTASWTDKTLIACGRFYPPGAKTAEGRLRYYASQFPIVEVDSSYYAMPAPATAQLWAERTPEGFVMNVKAFRLFTGHQTEPQVLHKDLQLAMGGSLPPRFFYGDLPAELIDELWKRFRECLLPLQAAGRLGLVHFQFPPWVVAGAPGRAQVEHCVQRMSGFDLGVEFRHGTWFAGAAQQRETIRFPARARRRPHRRRRSAGLLQQRARPLGGDASALRARAPARPQPRHLERQGPDLGLGPLQLRLSRGRAPGDGAADPAAGADGDADPRDLQQQHGGPGPAQRQEPHRPADRRRRAMRH